MNVFLKAPKGHKYVINFRGKKVLDIKTAWDNARSEAKVEDLHFHDLRHFAKRNFRKAGIRPEVIRAILGHKTAAMSDRYDAVFGDDFEDVKKAMG